MTDKIPGLMGFVARVLMEDRSVSSKELYERAQARYPEVGEMSVRQFHARYPLQARRQLNKPIVRRFPVPKPESAPPSASAQSADGQSANGESPTAAPATGTILDAVAKPDTSAAPAAAPGPAPAPTLSSRVAAAGPTRPPAEDPKKALRLLLFRLAMDLETAHSRADLVDVISRMDRYVDEAMTITRG